MSYLPAGDPSQTIDNGRHQCPGNLAGKALRPAVRRAGLMSLNVKRGRAKNQVTLGNQRRSSPACGQPPFGAAW